MIAAVCREGTTSEETVAFLRALGDAFGYVSGQPISSGHASVMAWDARPAQIDTAASVAWMGALRVDRATIDRTNAGGHNGAYSLLALRNDSLLAARSLFGGRPLYYAFDTGGRAAYACSRLAPLLRLLDAALEIDADRIAAHLVYGDSADPAATVFRGVRRLLPGEAIVLASRGATRTSRAALLPSAQPHKSIEEWSRDVRAEIERAVARATEGHRKIAVLASGGLDSSAVLAALVRPAYVAPSVPAADVLAMTLDFDAAGSDRPYFAALVAALGVEPVRVTPEECVHNAYSAMVIDGAPRPWPTNALDVQILATARARGADCVLTGIGGDFFWDQEIDSFGELAARGHLVAAIRGAIDLKAAFWMPKRLRRARDLVVLPFVRAKALSLIPPFARPAFRRARVRRALSYPDWAGPVLRSYLRGRRYRIFEAAERETSRAARMSALAWNSMLADGFDAMGQVETCAGAVETHVFFDVELARFLAEIPSEVTLADGWLRGVLRRAFRDVWPRVIVERTDKAMFAPAMHVANDGLRASGALDRLFEMRALGDLGLVEPAKWREAFADARRPGGDLTDAWTMLTCEAFASGIGKTPRSAVGGR